MNEPEQALEEWAQWYLLTQGGEDPSKAVKDNENINNNNLNSVKFNVRW